MGLCPKPHNFFEKKLSKSQFVLKIWNTYLQNVRIIKLKHYIYVFAKGVLMLQQDDNNNNKQTEIDVKSKTEAEYSAQIIKLLLNIIKWLIIGGVIVVALFLGTVIYLISTGMEIEIGQLNSNKPSVTALYIDNNQNNKTFDV